MNNHHISQIADTLLGFIAGQGWDPNHVKVALLILIASQTINVEDTEAVNRLLTDIFRIMERNQRQAELKDFIRKQYGTT